MHSRLKYLVNQYLLNSLSPQEKTELQESLNDPQNSGELLELMEEKWKQEDFVPRTLSAEDSGSILQNVIAAEQSQPEVHGKIIRIVPWWRKSVAIILILLCVTGAYLYFSTQKDTTRVTLAKNLAPLSDSLKRGDLAILTLSDGSRIQLNKLKSGTVAQDGNTTVSNNSGMLFYKAASESDHQRANILTTKKGQEYGVTLPDGSQVWLNGSSSVSFPVAFGPTERNVSITGEVLFRVAKDAKRPFRVSTSGPTIEVLGTFFNINDYPGERAVKTTLLEGSVALHSGVKTVRIVPGQQAVLNENGNFEVISLEKAEKEIAWSNGTMNFTNDSLATVIRNLERWYDIQVVDQTDGSVQGFTGPIPKNLNPEQLADFLGDWIDARVAGKKIILKNK